MHTEAHGCYFKLTPIPGTSIQGLHMIIPKGTHYIVHKLMYALSAFMPSFHMPDAAESMW